MSATPQARNRAARAYVPTRKSIQLFESLEFRTLLSSAVGQPILAYSPVPESSMAMAMASVAAAESAPIVLEAVAGVPALSSRPGAAYTVYLDFAGFAFTGNWGVGTSYNPGTTPAYNSDGNANAFSATEIAAMRNIWSRVAEKYSEFDVNVTTVDPAVAAGQASTDLARQNYYDSQPRMMHTVIGGSGGWIGGGGVSYVNVAPYSQSGSNGYHTNWVFSAQAPTNFQFIAEASAHEVGHALNLYHQSDYLGTSLVNQYSAGNSSFAPTMGVSYYTARGLWAVGTATAIGMVNQNDAQILANLPGMGGFIDDGVGNTFFTATPIPLTGNSVDSTLAKGTIVPLSTSSPTPIGAANYTDGWWSFSTSGGLVSLNANSGRSTITAGTSDPGATLDIVAGLYDSAGTLISNYSSSSSLSVSISTTLAAGTYYVKIAPQANLSDTNYTARTFFDMGSYFLTGTIPIPELPAISVAVSPTSVTEDGTDNLLYTFSRTGALDDPLTIDFTVSGSATASDDYTLSGADSFNGSTGTLTIPAGAASATVTIDPVADTTIETSETVVLSMASGAGYVPGTPSSATGTLTNDDLPKVNVSISPATVTEDDTTNFVYTFTSDAASPTPLTINFTVSGTATFNLDFVQSGAASFSPVAGTVTIPANATSTTLTVDAFNDSTYEFDETLVLTIASASTYLIGPSATATGTILNDDLPRVSVTVSPASVDEDGSEVLVYTFDRGIPASTALTFGVGFSGSASYGSDYTRSGPVTYNGIGYTVTIPANASTATVTIDPIADSSFESDESVVLTVFAGPNYLAGSPSSATGTIRNDDLPTVTLSVSQKLAGEDGTSNLTYTFTRSVVQPTPLTVYFNVSGTATLNDDFTAINATTFGATSGSITIPAGATTVTLTIDPTADAMPEADESVTLTLATSAEYFQGGLTTATGTIIDDEMVYLQDAGADKLVVMEAEINDGVTARSDKTWSTVTSASYSGGSALQATPNTGTVISSSFLGVSPQVDFKVNFLTTGVHYLWVRGRAASNTDDSVHVGLDGTNSWSSDNIGKSSGGFANASPVWVRDTLDGIIATLDITTPGLHVVNLYMREDGFIADRILLTTNSSYLPTGTGPATSTRGSASGAVTPDVTVTAQPASALEDGSTNLVFSFTRSGAISSPLTINFSVAGTALFNDDYTASGATSFTTTTGTITIPANAYTASITLDPTADLAIESDETVALTITSGAGYNVTSPSSAAGTIANDDGAAVLAYQQDSGSDKLVVIEAETNDGSVARSSKSWTTVTGAMYSGGQAMQASPNGSLGAVTTNITTTSPQLDFKVNFLSTGVHYIWVRGHGLTNQDDSVHVALDGVVQSTSDNIGKSSGGFISASPVWVKDTLDSVVATINVATLGVHTLNLFMREDGFIADRIVLTTNAAYTPSGMGPATSERNTGTPIDTTSPSVTVDQAASQIDPTSDATINFTVIFSEPVTNFAAEDVTLAGTAGATTAIVTGSGTTYSVAVTGMTTSGTVILTVPAGVASDEAGNPNLASTSTDNTVDYQLNPGTMAYQQDAGTDNLVVIETEINDGITARGGKTWSTVLNAMYAGGAALQATPNTGTFISSNIAATSPQVDFKINFVTTGVHYLWVRGRGVNNADDSLHIGLDGVVQSTSDNVGTSTGFYVSTTPRWGNLTNDGPDATIVVTTTGLHTLNLFMREDGFIADRILLTTSGIYSPNVTEPTTSARALSAPSPVGGAALNKSVAVSGVSLVPVDKPGDGDDDDEIFSSFDWLVPTQPTPSQQSYQLVEVAL